MRFEPPQSRRVQVPGCRGNAREVDGPCVASDAKLQRFLAGGQVRISAELRERRLGLRKPPLRMHGANFALLCLWALCAGPFAMLVCLALIIGSAGVRLVLGPTSDPDPPKWQWMVAKPIYIYYERRKYADQTADTGWQAPAASEGLQAEVRRPQFH